MQNQSIFHTCRRTTTNVEFTPSPRILRNLDQIGAYLQVHRRTAWRWILSGDLPAMKDARGTYITSTNLLDLWILAHWRIQHGHQTHVDVLEDLAI
jgi:hypothetical protein